MQYKSFIILGHAYFLNPYIQVARRVLVKGDQSPQKALQGFFFFSLRTQGSGQDGDDDGASQYTESASKHVSSPSSSGLCSHRITRCMFGKEVRLLRNKNKHKRTLQEVNSRASSIYQSIGLHPHFGVSTWGSQSVDVCCYVATGFVGRKLYSSPKYIRLPT